MNPSDGTSPEFGDHHEPVVQRESLLSFSALAPPMTEPLSTSICARVLSVIIMILTVATDLRGRPKKKYSSPDSAIGRTMRYTSPTEGLTPSGKVMYTSPVLLSSMSGRSKIGSLPPMANGPMDILTDILFTRDNKCTP